MNFQPPIDRIFLEYASDLVLTIGGANRTVRAFLIPADGGTINTYYDGNESVGLVRPALAGYVAGTQSHPPGVGDVFTFDGRIWTVQKLQGFYVSGLLLMILFLSD